MRAVNSGPALGNAQAPYGSTDWALAQHHSLKCDAEDWNKPLRAWADDLDLMVEPGNEAWKLVLRADGRPFPSLVEWLEAPRPWGIGIKAGEVLRRLETVPTKGQRMKALLREALGEAPAAQAHPVIMLPLASVRADHDVQPREKLNKTTVKEYAEALGHDVSFPPVVVFFDGETHWLADGFHRHAAHVAAERPEILTEVREGDREDAIIHATGANKAHGLPMTAGDRRRAVAALVQTSKWAGRSAREVAAHVGVSDHTVTKVRQELVSGAQIAHLPERTTGKDGKSYPAKKHKAAPTVPEGQDAPVPAASLAPASVADELRAAIEAMTWQSEGGVYTRLANEHARGKLTEDEHGDLLNQHRERKAALRPITTETDEPTTPEAPESDSAERIAHHAAHLEQSHAPTLAKTAPRTIELGVSEAMVSLLRLLTDPDLPSDQAARIIHGVSQWAQPYEDDDLREFADAEIRHAGERGVRL